MGKNIITIVIIVVTLMLFLRTKESMQSKQYIDCNPCPWGDKYATQSSLTSGFSAGGSGQGNFWGCWNGNKNYSTQW